MIVDSKGGAGHGVIKSWNNAGLLTIGATSFSVKLASTIIYNEFILFLILFIQGG